MRIEEFYNWNVCLVCSFICLQIASWHFITWGTCLIQVMLHILNCIGKLITFMFKENLNLWSIWYVYEIGIIDQLQYIFPWAANFWHSSQSLILTYLRVLSRLKNFCTLLLLFGQHVNIPDFQKVLLWVDLDMAA